MRIVNFLVIFLFILSFDAFSTIPSAVLRLEGRPIQYMLSKVIGSLVLLFLVVFSSNGCPKFPEGILGLKYNPEIGVGYVFYCQFGSKYCDFSHCRQKNL